MEHIESSSSSIFSITFIGIYHSLTLQLDCQSKLKTRLQTDHFSRIKLESSSNANDDASNQIELELSSNRKCDQLFNRGFAASQRSLTGRWAREVNNTTLHRGPLWFGVMTTTFLQDGWLRYGAFFVAVAAATGSLADLQVNSELARRPTSEHSRKPLSTRMRVCVCTRVAYSAVTSTRNFGRVRIPEY